MSRSLPSASPSLLSSAPSGSPPLTVSAGAQGATSAMQSPPLLPSHFVSSASPPLPHRVGPPVVIAAAAATTPVRAPVLSGSSKPVGTPAASNTQKGKRAVECDDAHPAPSSNKQRVSDTSRCMRCHDKECMKWRELTAKEALQFGFGQDQIAFYCTRLPRIDCSVECHYCDGMDECVCKCMDCPKIGRNCLCKCPGCNQTNARCLCVYAVRGRGFTVKKAAAHEK